jgi:hypothetical protein
LRPQANNDHFGLLACRLAGFQAPRPCPARRDQRIKGGIDSASNIEMGLASRPTFHSKLQVFPIPISFPREPAPTLTPGHPRRPPTQLP